MKIKRPNKEELWILASLILAGILIAMLLSRIITPFFNYVIWGIER